ncbi:UDP-N-acetylmuramoylalanine--D-glutamate ligase [Solemya velesiana gill symbiont]|uniref:UDP-N-acetylmuramoylalanine--D-glutamate ligase n=2 Tax=Solemya velesiana gill symbiont TaxID=1918948 RepID=A0A1T2KWS3_9GAMM|nr:UDP-N-acetylmuramoylalanine--D-glutamate ligase [Solemya velesiana gill symbiont]
MDSMETGKTLVVGLGKTGLSCARFLAARGVSAAITDSREQPPGLEELRRELPDTALFLGAFDAAVFEAADRLVVSPGVPVDQPLIRDAMARGVPVIGDIELFAQEVNAPMAAITGSNGKSSVTTLLGEMADKAGRQVKVGGNLGEPALDLLSDDADLYVLELSSFQLETTHTLASRVAVVLNVSADHMDRYDSLASYADAKARIYHHAEVGVFNLDDPLVMAMQGAEKSALFFTLGEPGKDSFGLRIEDERLWLCFEQERLVAADELRVPGSHNLANALAALAMGRALELPMSAMLDALRAFRGLPHRTQFVAEHAGVSWYNDSKGTNVGACIAALRGFASTAGEDRTVLIAGGDDKGADFSDLKPVVKDTARGVVLIGQDAQGIADAIGDTVPVAFAEDMKEAVALAAGLAQPGDRVLLSPVCASFDMYRSYEHRGEVFMTEVGRLVS